MPKKRLNNFISTRLTKKSNNNGSSSNKNQQGEQSEPQEQEPQWVDLGYGSILVLKLTDVLIADIKY